MYYDVVITSRRLGCALRTGHRLHYAPVKRDTASTLHPLFRDFLPDKWEIGRWVYLLSVPAITIGRTRFLSSFAYPYLDYDITSVKKMALLVKNIILSKFFRVIKFSKNWVTNQIFRVRVIFHSYGVNCSTCCRVKFLLCKVEKILNYIYIIFFIKQYFHFK